MPRVSHGTMFFMCSTALRSSNYHPSDFGFSCWHFDYLLGILLLFLQKKKFISCKCTSFNSKIKFEKWMLRNRESVSLPPRSYIQNPTECEMNTVTASKAHKTLLVFVYLPTYLTLRRYFISIKDLWQNYFQFPVLVLFNSKRCSVLLLI